MSFKCDLIELGSVCEIKSGKRLPKGHTLTSNPTSNPYIRLVDIDAGRISQGNIQFIDEDTKSKIKKYIVEENDVCLAIVGHTIGVVFFVEKEWDGCNLTENAARITKLDSRFNPKFIYYYLNSTAGQHEIVSRKVGSAQGKLPLYNINKIPIPNIKLLEQNFIVAMLDSLDKKIRLNESANQTLEQMSKALFKSWFVDFEPVKAKMAALEAGGSQEDATLAAMTTISGKNADVLAVFEREHPEQYAELKATVELFPSAMHVSELGEIPEGWMVNPTSAHYNISIGKTPPRKEAQWFSTTDGDLKWVSIKDMGIASTYISETSERLTHEAVKKFNIKVMPADTVFLSFKLTVGRICITTEDMCSNEAIAHFTPKENKYKSHWLYHALHSFDFNKLGSTSSIATAVNSKTIRDMKLIFPNELISQRYTEKVSSLMQLQKLNAGQINSLTLLRDTLLPKLLSGEITLPEAEQAVSETENV